MTLAQKRTLLIASVCVAIHAQAEFAHADEDGPSPSPGSLVDFRPNWSIGDTWEMSASSLACQRPVPTRGWRSYAMTIVGTPSAERSSYVIRASYTVDKQSTFMVLDAGDLSLIEVRHIDRARIGARDYDRILDHWQAAPTTGAGIRGEPRIAHSGFLVMAFPVLSGPLDQITKPGSTRCAQIIKITTVGGSPAIVAKVARTCVEANARERLINGGFDYVLVWKHGDPWWTICWQSQSTSLFHMLVEPETDEEKARPFAQRFEERCANWLALTDSEDILERRIRYEKLLQLGKGAVPLMIERVREGDTKLIPAISELTGGIRKKANRDRCLQWWSQVNSR
jgi:hypothetical protein